jgi:hypothetical protein
MKATVEIIKETKYGKPTMYVLDPIKSLAVSSLTKKVTVNDQDIVSLTMLGLKVEVITEL